MEGAKINFADIIGFIVLLFVFGMIVVAIGIHLFIALYAVFANPKPARYNSSKEENKI
jgi:hypothetical protein